MKKILGIIVLLLVFAGCNKIDKDSFRISGQLNNGESKSLYFLEMTGQGLMPIDTIEIDENHIVAFQGFSPSQIQAGWSVGNVLRGEGLSLMKVTGPGKVYLSPLPMIVYKNN